MKGYGKGLQERGKQGIQIMSTLSMFYSLHSPKVATNVIGYPQYIGILYPDLKSCKNKCQVLFKYTSLTVLENLTLLKLPLLIHRATY